MVAKSRTQSEKKRESAIEALDSVLDSKFLTALSEPSRIEVLKQVIRHGRADVSELSKHLDYDRSVISRHLSLLQEVGILHREKSGKHVYYQLNPSAAIQKFKFILKHLEELVSICCPPSDTNTSN
ncbi:transcriptional regulator [Leptospira yanagawae]|uniref:Transcriptional regulator n=1 Tax=Leptospira yanagawae TaxID=293069 RepID=A0ABY2M4K8_9LEPT|nr:transcriptional regulator [Leptospira yanagawae]